MIFMGPDAGKITTSSTSYISISPPTSGVYHGLSIFMDRSNTNNIALTGSSAGNFNATIYGAASSVTLTGTSANTVFNSMVVSSKVILTGTSVLTLNYDPSQNYGGGGNSSIELSE